MLVDLSMNRDVDVGEPDHTGSSRLNARNKGANSSRVQSGSIDGDSRDEAIRPSRAHTIGAVFVSLVYFTKLVVSLFYKTKQNNDSHKLANSVIRFQSLHNHIVNPCTLLLVVEMQFPSIKCLTQLTGHKGGVELDVRVAHKKRCERG